MRTSRCDRQPSVISMAIRSLRPGANLALTSQDAIIHLGAPDVLLHGQATVASSTSLVQVVIHTPGNDSRAMGHPLSPSLRFGDCSAFSCTMSPAGCLELA